MRFRNIKTNEVVEAKSFTQLFAFSHNSNYVLINEKEPVAEESVEETTEEVEVKKSPKKKK